MRTACLRADGLRTRSTGKGLRAKRRAAALRFARNKGGAQTVRNTYKYLSRASPRQRVATNLVYWALEFNMTLVICPQCGASPRTARHGTRQRLRPSLSARRGARESHAEPVRPVNNPARQPNRRRSMGHLRCPQTHLKCFARRVFLASGYERDHSKI